MNNEITFTLQDPGEPILVLSKEGFIYKGERIDDVGKAYDLFIEFFTKANSQKETNETLQQ